jgi:hypothetical protein
LCWLSPTRRPTTPNNLASTHQTEAGLALAVELELSYMVASLEQGRKEALAFLRLNPRAVN